MKVRRLVSIIVTIAIGMALTYCGSGQGAGASGAQGTSGGGSAPTMSTITWSMMNTCSFTVYARFFDENNNSFWPANGGSYILDAGNTYNIPTTCTTGDQICNGGAGTTDGAQDAFGVGLNNTQACQGCCYTCGNFTTPTISIVTCQ